MSERRAENCPFYPACYIAGDCEREGWRTGICGLPKTAQPVSELSVQVKRAVEAYKAMSPVEKTLHDADQRRSWVRGQVGRDPGPDVLAEEVRRLRAEVAARPAPPAQPVGERRERILKILEPLCCDRIHGCEGVLGEEGYCPLGPIADALLSSDAVVLSGGLGGDHGSVGIAPAELPSPSLANEVCEPSKGGL